MSHTDLRAGRLPRTAAARAALVLAAALGPALGACTADPLPTAPNVPRSSKAAAPSAARAADELVLAWADVELEAVRASNPGPPRTSRAIAIVHTAMYDAWAAYDADALGTRTGSAPRQPTQARTEANKRRAVSFAAYRALAVLFPGQQALFDGLMAKLGYAPADAATGDAADPAVVGTAAANAVVEFRRYDGANQTGTEGGTARLPYADYTGYAPLNSWDVVRDPTRWQPLRVTNAAGVTSMQQFLAPHWSRVRSFALTSGAQFRPPPPRASDKNGPYMKQLEDMLHASAKLGDEEKAIAEYWADGPKSETPPGHWCLLAASVVRRDGLGLDDQVRLFFALGNAVMDAGIAAWDAKRTYDTARPITAVRTLKAGKPIRAWGGPGRGTVQMLGEQWRPYQDTTVVTPAFPEYVSGHSTFSAAAATVLARFTGSDAFGLSVTIAPGSSRIEPGLTPARAVTLTWPTFTAAADQAGLSRRYGGIHFEDGDLAGRALGRQVGAAVWKRASDCWTGRACGEVAVAMR